MGNFFGTDGVRGIANKELTCELAIKIGKAAAKVLTENNHHKAKILIGKDTRISSDMLESALLAGICSLGAEGISLGVVPTPAVAHLVKKYGADAGIMISASHNSFEFNGIKLFDKNGYKLPDETEHKIERLIMENDFESSGKIIGKDLGIITKCTTAVDDYLDYICSTVCNNLNKNLKIAVDCANGSASVTARKLFKKLNIKADILFDNPNGININDNCGSTHLENLKKYITDNNYDIGIAFDGDADRCLAVDETGNIIDGDNILAICGKALKQNGKLKNNPLVATIMSNMGLKVFCKENDIDFSETKVGDRYVLERMLKENYLIGGEQSGHIIFLEHSTTGDGQLTAVQLLSVLSGTNKKVSELKIKKYPQKSSEILIESSQKGLLSKNKNINKYIAETTKKLDSKGRIVLRESGTEPKIRIMFEHEDESKLDGLINEAKEIIKNNL
ncbi:MAG: phosphoglucosamine mutase [Clostridia bacterium]|nr:phosphoglucosamine mutase [Clostridia bacterium]